MDSFETDNFLSFESLPFLYTSDVASHETQVPKFVDVLLGTHAGGLLFLFVRHNELEL